MDMFTNKYSLSNSKDSPDLIPRESYTKEELKLKGQQLSECMLSNSVGTVIGVGVGMYLGITRKHLRPFVYAITAGTFTDIMYGYCGNCTHRIDDYRRAKNIYEASLKVGDDTKNETLSTSVDNCPISVNTEYKK